MAPSLDRVLAGLGSGLQTFAGLQGQANRYKDEQAQQEQERQRQISRDALAKALGDAQIGNLAADNERQDNQFAQNARTAKVNEVMGRINLQRGEQDKQFARSAGPKPQGLMNVAPGGTVYNPDTHKPEFKAPDRPEKPKDLAKPSIGAETAYGILPVLKQADQELDTLTGSDLGALISRKGGILGRYFLTPEQKQYNDAIDDFSLQYTTAIHGKRVNSETVHGVQNMLRIVPGDDEGTIKRKVARRKEFLQAAERFGAGATSYHAKTDNAGGEDDASAVAGGTDAESAFAKWQAANP